LARVWHPISVSAKPSASCDGAIHLWLVWLTATELGYKLGWSLLPEPELALADRRTERFAREFILSRATLRALAARYTGVPPEAIRYRVGAHGKPWLEWNPANIFFNVSHSGGLVFFAFGTGCELGVDVERVRPIDDMEEIAGRYFCQRESRQLQVLTAEQRTEAFFRCWTRKEAYIKADGRGLSCALDSFAVTFGNNERARVVHIDGDSEAAAAWTLQAPDVAPGYVSASAYRDAPRPLVFGPPQTAEALLCAI